ncbi:magnesium chelatase ATPase subunit I [Polymorphobacter fuscus]|uniref:Mg-protoporphyrin IX chelatase n=1 Tax=Sandarakinorhabdus fusca TaxID=1439888 RepID=A0A7C9KYB6_9SPHN|nr:magnesium chelatase ATPase subunit I [Polymorphobacter fuscus]KAB7644865.1 magnesium chelatase ATPase subunit I [Polymorphobacter fuscus]MQT18146.1 magnesium chelatase ATPase subunit I [Polymorphobacter fuscus]NJC09464.1 magnesium chelatase subunit I [Polymorphobacter fuscus]
MKAPFPFSAIVGQSEMKQALLMAAVEPRLGGVMVFGDRGTGKSTAVRALAALLPPMTIVAGCRYGCAPGDPAPCPDDCRARAGKAVAEVPVPFIDLPLGATEDRVVGSLDLERALATGEKRFEPGLLAKANRGFLYIDEINLLEDHLVDLLLDVAVSGQNLVEREGLSIRHAARFILVGSGNPEEGELRPQLLDRFGLSVDVRTPTELADRIEIVKRCDRFDRDPQGFAATYAAEEAATLARIAAARKRLPKVEVADAMLELGSRLCQAVGADGLRGELTLLRAARAAAALAGKKAVTAHHVGEVATLALRHRLRRNVTDDVGSTVRITRAVAELIAA